MWVFPLAAALIAAVFAVLLGRQFAARKRPYQAMWTIALAMYSVASLALFIGVLSGWSPFLYRTYWLFGAVLNVPFLAQGEIYLLVKNKAVANGFLVILLVATGFAVVAVFGAPLHAPALSELLPKGKAVWGPGSFALHLAQYYAYPTYTFLLAGTLWSAWKMRGKRELRNRFYGTLAIAVGATVVAAGAAFAALGLLLGFSVTLVAGIALMFWGFVLASRQAAARPPVAPETAEA